MVTSSLAMKSDIDSWNPAKNKHMHGSLHISLQFIEASKSITQRERVEKKRIWKFDSYIFPFLLMHSPQNVNEFQFMSKSDSADWVTQKYYIK